MTSVDEALSYDRDAVGIGRKGTIDKPYLLKAPFWTVDTLFYAIPKSDIDLEFVHCSFLNVDWKSKDESTGLPSLSKEAINETIALVPSFNEQSQLGEFFNNLNSLITLHQRKRRNGSFTHPLAWEQRKLGEITERYKELVATPQDGYTRMGVRSHAKGTFLAEVEPGQQIEERELSKVRANNLVVNIVFAWEHAVAITTEKDAKALVSHRFPQFSFHDDMEPDFFRYATLDPDFKNHLWLASPSGAGRNKTLNIKTMLEYKFDIPLRSEQARIAVFFQHLDSLITLHQ